jgi:hypothetical protein
MNNGEANSSTTWNGRAAKQTGAIILLAIVKLFTRRGVFAR